MRRLAYIGLGSNLDQPLKQVQSACATIDQSTHTIIRCRSPWYGSKAVGPGDQNDYVNGVVEVETTLPATDLLCFMQKVEQSHHRIRTEHWGPRTLDLDLLWYDAQQIDLPNLQVPHPRICERNFVLFPLRDLAPNLCLFGEATVAELSQAVPCEGVWRL